VLDPASVRRGLQLIQTTSPHFAIMASIDLARREMALHGRELLDQALQRARDAATRLAAIPGLRVLRPDDLAGSGTGLHQLDETKLLIGTSGLTADARDVVERLNRVHGVQPELSGTAHVLCISTIGNTDDDFERLVAGFTEVASHAGQKSEDAGPGLIGDLLAVRPETVLTPREAFFAADEAVPLQAATGRIAAEAITPYPPGIPLVMPGERLDTDVVELLLALRDRGNPISASDPTMELVLVVS
jgi:arginine/lysine/ornithine decarboxylase